MSIKFQNSKMAWESKRQSRQFYEMQTDLDLLQKNQEIAVLRAVQSEQSKRVALQKRLNIALIAILLGALCFLGFTGVASVKTRSSPSNKGTYISKRLE